jgi:hypothetical protein
MPFSSSFSLVALARLLVKKTLNWRGRIVDFLQKENENNDTGKGYCSLVAFTPLREGPSPGYG